MASATIERAVEELLAQAEASLPPPRPPRATAALDAHWVPAVLSIGGALAEADQVVLEQRGCLIEVAPDLAAGLAALMARRWDIVAVHPTIDADADGLRFVRALKCRPAEAFSVGLGAVVRKVAAVPFVILPLAGSTEAAVFRSATDWGLAEVGSGGVAKLLLEGAR